MIEVQHAEKSFSDKKVLFDINAIFEKGKNNLIIGQSGSGKTVLIKSILGLLELDSGKILFDGRDFTSMRDKKRKRIQREIGVVFQGGALFDSIDIAGNVGFPLEMFSSMTYRERKKRVDFCLDVVNLEGVENKFPSELSGGMQKRVAIARAIVLNPKYLLCDEPNSGLDPKTAILIDDLITDITREFDITTIVNTHDMNSVLQMGDFVVFIYKGQKWWEGSKATILKSDNEELNNFVFANKILQANN